MKKFVFCAALIFSVGIYANAQRVSNRINAPQSVKTDEVIVRTDTSEHTANFHPVSNRVIYKSEKTHQAATVTGQEATGTGAAHSPYPKNALQKGD